jgi:UrcA family protein
MIAAAFICAAALPTLATAAPTTDFVTRDVSTTGLDLASPRGIAALKQRVRDAAKTVCEAANAPADLLSDTVRACRADAFRSAEPDLRAAIHVAETRRIQVSANSR